MDDALIDNVLRAVALVPRGRVVSYGDLAELVGTGPRQVGLIMSRFGSDVAWWRVTNAAGELPGPLLERAFPHWSEEGIVLRPSGRGCSMARYRADLAELGRRYDAAEINAGRRR